MERPTSKSSVAEAKASLRAYAASADNDCFRPLATKLSLGALALGACASLLAGGGLKGLGKIAGTLLRVAPALIKLV